MNVTMCLCLSTCRRIEAQEKALQQEATALQEKIEAEKRKAEAEQKLKMEAEQREQQQREQQLKMEEQQREQQLREEQQREQQLKMEEQAKKIGGDTFSQIGAAKFSPTPMLITQSPQPSTFKVTISQPANQPKRSISNSNSNSCLLNSQTVYPQNASHPKLPTVNHHAQAWGPEVVKQEAATKAGSSPKSTTTRSLILEPTASKAPPSPKAPALASSGALAPTIPLRNPQSRQSDSPQDVAQAHSRGSAPAQGHPRIVSDGACVASQCSAQP